MAFRQNNEVFSSQHDGFVRRALERSVKFDVLANDSIVLSANNDPNATVGTFAALIEWLGGQGRLAVSADWSAPFEDFFRGIGARFNYDTANLGVLERAWAQSDSPLTVANLETVAYSPDVVGQLSVKSEVANAERSRRIAAEREAREKVEAAQYREEMYGWCEAAQQAMLAKRQIDNYQFQRALKIERNRLDATDYAALHADITRRREMRRIKGMSAADYRAEVTISRAAGQQPAIQPKMQAALNQYETLPAQYTTRSGLTVEMNRAGILKVANSDSFSFRELVRRFGSEAINDVLAGRV